MPAAGTSIEWKGVFAASRRRPAGKRLRNPGAVCPGLAQCAASGRIGIGPQHPPGQGRGQRVVIDPRRQIGRRDTERGREIHGRAAAEAVAAARQPVVMPMLMGRCLPVVVGMLFGAGLVVSAVEMKRGMGVAAHEGERQQQNQAAEKQGSLHGTGAQLRSFGNVPESLIAQGCLKVKWGPAWSGVRGGIDSQ